ncbi:hypothetical protein HYDPIDRAFT_33314 [Hydnomerulius pinastri MD-312]|uniref:Uncharacterized protein n=1 Tax=Hydnomerulius pinastri MD-312 TaxID=994086 RepID=A0A0C9W8F8_9AGAM|nr:hypothetical protein HYDPIDRAFT_33314 [Hydnomerulius pinastri MD-312]
MDESPGSRRLCSRRRFRAEGTASNAERRRLSLLLGSMSLSPSKTLSSNRNLKNNDLSTVSFQDWFARLEKRAEGASSEDPSLPAIKLLEFFRGMACSDQISRSQSAETDAGGIANFDTSKSQFVSQTMARMQAVGDAEAGLWVRYWCSKGFF